MEDDEGTGDELEALRAALATRVVSCWERLEDAVSELIEVHAVSRSEIGARLTALLEDL